MADRYGRRLPLMINVFFYATSRSSGGFAQTYWQFIGCGSCSHRHGR